MSHEVRHAFKIVLFIRLTILIFRNSTPLFTVFSKNTMKFIISKRIFPLFKSLSLQSIADPTYIRRIARIFECQLLAVRVSVTPLSLSLHSELSTRLISLPPIYTHTYTLSLSLWRGNICRVARSHLSVLGHL